jgi:hypothetical protein
MRERSNVSSSSQGPVYVGILEDPSVVNWGEHSIIPMEREIKLVHQCV